MELIIMIIIGVIISGILGFSIFYLIRYMKGSLDIKLIKNSFQNPELIVGQLQMKAKKQIESDRLFVAIVAYEIRSSYRNGKSGGRETVEISRFEQDLEYNKTYSSGFRNTYNFEIAFPRNPIQDTGKVSTGNSTSDKMVSGILSLANKVSRKRNIFWKIEARLDATGVDLFTSKKIYLNFNQNQDNNQN